MESSLLTLRGLFDAIYPLPESTWGQLSLIWKPFEAGRKQIMTSPGETEKYLYFVVEGVQRIYYLDDQNREATIAFTYPPSFGGILDSLLMQRPSQYYYETLTATKFLRASWPDLQAVMRSSPDVERMLLAGVVQTFSGVLERLVEVQCFSSEEKFRKLLARSPHILQLVPHKYLANYLGIDPTNFSKLVNRVRI